MKKITKHSPTGMAFIIPIFLLLVSITASAQTLEGRSNSHQLLLSSVTAPPVSVSKESLPDGTEKTPVNISDKTKVTSTDKPVVATTPKPLIACLTRVGNPNVGGGGCTGLACSGNACDQCARITLQNNAGCTITAITVTCSDPNVCFAVCWGGTVGGCNTSFQKTSGVCDNNAKGLDQGTGFAQGCRTYIDICYHLPNGAANETFSFTTNADPTCCNDALNDTATF
jgi:hypothetical protein